MEIDPNNTPTFYTKRGFHAIGSGSVAAQVANGLFSHYEAHQLSIQHLTFVAYLTVTNCISVLANFGVGGSVRLWQGKIGHEFSEVSGPEFESLEVRTEHWRTFEREGFAELFPGEEPDSTGTPPMPDQLQDDPP